MDSGELFHERPQLIGRLVDLMRRRGMEVLGAREYDSFRGAAPFAPCSGSGASDNNKSTK